MELFAARLPVSDLQGLVGNGEQAQSFVDAVGGEENFAVLLLEESFINAVVEEAEQLIVEAVDVEQEDGLLMKLEGVPGEDFEEFFEGSEASGKRDEGVGSLTHEGLACVHGVGDVQLGDALVGDFEIDQYFRNDADDIAASGEGCFSRSTHEADSGTAIDEAYVVFGQRAAQVSGYFAVAGVNSIG